ncbi:uncharacterized protein LOC119077409 [Bradysia coprophila]|uniref:uncharacterized protein LOC119077409 n=1 Tax=Bradysia coprophila TaxID=38358 RepID=UPI00187DCB19|nr:uncharacterized protein LOC119077409 [Bradysia coprophila]XP_037040517.1 uncharacterized protein LOC119077409 [Bradysia coprophila]
MKTKYILVNEQKIWSPESIAVLNKYQGFELARSSNEHGTIIEYISDDIPGYVFRNMKELLSDDNELLRYIFPNFINTAHYLQNRDANVVRVPEPGQYMIPSPYVVPYLINATWHPLMSMLPSASSEMDVAPRSDLSPTIDLSSPMDSEDYSNMETTSHARSAPSSPYASTRRTTHVDLRSGRSRYSPYTRNQSQSPPLQFRSHSRVSPSRQFYGSQTFGSSQRQRPTSTVTSQSTYSGVSPSHRFTHHSPGGASNYSQDLRGATSSSMARASDSFRSTRPQQTHSRSRSSPSHRPSRQRDRREDGNYRHSSRYDPRR